MWTPLDEYIATALVKIMKEKNVTASELSLRIGRNSDFISHSLSRTDSNRQKLNIYQLNSIAQALDCSLSDLLPSPFLDYDEIKYNWRLNNE
ncbi:helix-turn-helix domain-containing protein [Culturomica massiliensis]|uniref:helix-turn-helix domain-containing protein n=1 Tax=Culturomica massiliensis TaxID=1841857 RepID=UPI0008382D45|nr:helix-turn-helix transcriptional regulator [Culturomica massiliensis]